MRQDVKDVGLAIQTDGLTKTYPPARRGAEPRTAVRDLSLSVAQGDVFGFLGANGAGKTTTVKMLLGFHSRTAGSAALFGVPIDDPKARRLVGYLPEQPYFPRFLTAGETVRMHARLAGRSRSETGKAATDCLERVGMDAHARTPLAKLSKGMTQRVALAAALVGDPQLLILDEPASGLDPIARRDMVALLKELAAEGRTIFLSSHYLSEVESLCSRVAILKSGVLVAEGMPSEIARQVKKLEGGAAVVVTARDLTPEAADRVAKDLGTEAEAVEEAPPGAVRLLVPEGCVYRVLSALEQARATLVSVVPARGESLEAAFFRLVEEAA